jgi:hypothetical protein
MEDYPVVPRVTMMTMTVPIAAVDVDLHVSLQEVRLICEDNGVPKVRAIVTVSPARVDHFESFALFSR